MHRLMPSLPHSEGGRYVVEDGISQMTAPEDNDQAVLIVSEKLTEDAHWTLIQRIILLWSTVASMCVFVRSKPDRLILQSIN